MEKQRTENNEKHVGGSLLSDNWLFVLVKFFQHDGQITLKKKNRRKYFQETIKWNLK